MRTDILERKEEILRWIDKKYSKNKICEILNCKQETLNCYLEKMNIVYGGNREYHNLSKEYLTANNYLFYGSNITSYRLKGKLIKDGIKNEKCEKCQNDKWLGEPIPLSLHHKDGDNKNNNLSNLEILCNNCHGLSYNFAGKNKLDKNGVRAYEKKICRCGGQKKTKANLCKKCHYEKFEKKQENNICGCSIKINKKSKKCTKCYHTNQRKVVRPDVTTLLLDVHNLGYSGTGRKYGVSDNAIRKWIKYYKEMAG